MKLIDTNENIINLIESNKIAVIYFTGIDCGACETIKHKVEEILKEFPKIESREISGEKHPDVASVYSVFSLPVLLLFIEGKEFLRLGRNIDLLQLRNDIKRYYNMIY